MATREAARALDKADEIGTLEPGKRADLLVLNLARPHLTPMFDVYSHLVYAAGRDDVETVVIHGRTVMRDRVLTTMDEQQVIAKVQAIAAQVQPSPAAGVT